MGPRYEVNVQASRQSPRRSRSLSSISRLSSCHRAPSPPRDSIRVMALFSFISVVSASFFTRSMSPLASSSFCSRARSAVSTLSFSSSAFCCSFFALFSSFSDSFRRNIFGSTSLATT